MRKIVCMLAACLLIAAMTVSVWADASVQSMIDGLPTVEEFQTMDSDAQLEAYNKTQAAYDAYMALSEAERSEISGGEEVFETLFSHFNSLVMPVEAPAEAVEAEPESTENTPAEDFLVILVTLAVLVIGYGILGRKKR